MVKFDYFAPATLEEALAFLTHHGEEAKIIAGGTALLVVLKQRLFRPAYLLDLKTVPDLSGIDASNGTIRIGALATHRDLETAPEVATALPALTEAAGGVGSVQIRNRATVGGSLCYGEPLTDLPPLLMALGASARIAGPKGERVVPLEEFFVDYYETVVQPDEILTEVQVPKLTTGSGSAYQKFTSRTVMDKTLVGAATVVKLNSSTGTCDEARIILGAVASTPVRVVEAEDMIRGRELADSLIQEAARSGVKGIAPSPDIRCSEEYKREIAEVLIRRAINEAWRKAAEAR